MRHLSSETDRGIVKAFDRDRAAGASYDPDRRVRELNDELGWCVPTGRLEAALDAPVGSVRSAALAVQRAKEVTDFANKDVRYTDSLRRIYGRCRRGWPFLASP